ncbi:hypothetical protein HNY73_012280 [Argiope bruennichi]|uniref:Uncharacterized protein n=1 Tax=Argiope bruennichi TaxID=94029 RepID=A0A8T0EZ68_ARGBR|nr:hypothetical protein HNY73_012280 [Argiope bruennichi]
MTSKHKTNDMTETFLQTENLQTAGVHDSNIKKYKGNSCGIKYGLSELSNDKTYLETELPARKRFKPELFNTAKCLNKIYKVIGNEDESTNFVNKEKYSGEVSNIVSGEQEFENNLSEKGFLKSDLNAEINQQSESSVKKFCKYNSVFQSNILGNQFKLNSNEVNECNFKKKSENHDFEINLENDSCKNLDNDEISNRGTESETEFDDEFNKCCKLLNLDVPKIAVVSTTGTKIESDNCGRKFFENTKIGNPNYKNQNLHTLYPLSNKLVSSLKNMPNDEGISLETVNLDKKLELQDELLNKKNNCEDNMEFKDESNLVLSTMVISDSFSTSCNKNCINMNDKDFHDEINVIVEDNNSFESEFKHNDKYNSNLKLKNILNLENSSIWEPNFFISKSQNYDSKSNSEHLNLTIKDPLSSDRSKFQETNQIISHDNLNVDKDEVGKRSSTINDSGDILILYDESDPKVTSDETKEISETNGSESAHAILEETSSKNEIVFHASQENDSKINAYTNNEVEKKDNFIFNKKIDLSEVTYPLDDNKNCESPVLVGTSNDNYIENKSDLDTKLNESFVSEYEISLLEEDTDSILSEESLDSEYETSLLEDDINMENQNEMHENKSSNVDEKDEKIPEGYAKEFKVDEKIPEGCAKEFKVDEENEQTIGKINLSEKETDKIIFKSKICSDNIFETNIASCPKEKIASNHQIATKTDLDVTKSVQEKEIQIFNKIGSSENTNDKPEQNLPAIIDGTTTLKSEQPANLKSENPNEFDDIHIKRELPENIDASHCQLKLETNNGSQTSNKMTLNNNKFKNSKEVAIITPNKHIAESANINKPITEKSVKIELDVLNNGELKQNLNEEYQLSSEAVFKNKKNEIRKNKEKESVANTEKQFTESTSNDKVISEKTVKTDSEVSTSGELKQDVQNIIYDYYEEEKEDLINPGWNKIRELSTDEERYRQVRDCWKSKNIPNPFKNLTYYSYRKRKVACSENNNRETKQHKRHASTNLNDKNAKRSRSCTYIFDDRIKSIEKEKEIKAKTLEDKMLNEVSRINELHFQEETVLERFYGYNFDTRRQFQLNSLRRDYEQRVSSVTARYEQKINVCCDKYITEINNLKNSRNEVLQFYSFYKGLNTNEYKDPTVLTNSQIQELEEIENIYNQMDLLYK